MSNFNKIDCQALSFSPELSSKRLSKAQLIFGEKVLNRIICFCLYILGARRIDISKAARLPENTVRTVLKSILRDGFAAFFESDMPSVFASVEDDDLQRDFTAANNAATDNYDTCLVFQYDSSGIYGRT